MKLVPLYNKMLVEIIKDEDESTTESGIILVGKQDPYYRGKVLAVGKGHYQNAQRIKMDIEEGDVVRFMKNSGMGVSFDTAGNVTEVILTDNDVWVKEVEED